MKIEAFPKQIMGKPPQIYGEKAEFQPFFQNLSQNGFEKSPQDLNSRRPPIAANPEKPLMMLDVIKIAFLEADVNLEKRETFPKNSSVSSHPKRMQYTN